MTAFADAVYASSYSLEPFEVDGILYDRGAVVAESWARPAIVEFRPDSECYCTEDDADLPEHCWPAAYSWREGDWVYPGGAA